MTKFNTLINFKDGSAMYHRDSQEAFNNAKAKGLANPDEYMYMYSQGTKDYFKAIIDRKYINFTQ
tara:strand:- start:277 stop:471 length:195 start_codon:yes stop_codon:yes gene_type:complete